MGENTVCLRHPDKPEYVCRGGAEHWAIIVIDVQGRWAVASAHSARNDNLTGTLVKVFAHRSTVRGWRVVFFSVRFLRLREKNV